MRSRHTPAQPGSYALLVFSGRDLPAEENGVDIAFGQGQIGYVGPAVLLTHPALDRIPAVMAMPEGGVDEEISRVRVAAVLCAGNAEGARALQQAALPGSAKSSCRPGPATGDPLGDAW